MLPFPGSPQGQLPASALEAPLALFGYLLQSPGVV